MFKLWINRDYCYEYLYLSDCIDKMCKILKNYNLLFYADKGKFEITKNPFKNSRSKIKKYIVDIKIPKLKLTIHNKGSEELDLSLFEYLLRKHIGNGD